MAATIVTPAEGALLLCKKVFLKDKKIHEKKDLEVPAVRREVAQMAGQLKMSTQELEDVIEQILIQP